MATEVFKISKNDWAVIGQLAAQYTREDARKGIFQNDKKRLKYKSKSYVRYKKNDMRKFGRGKSKKGAGERLKGYENISISSKRTNYVNLTLTGNLLNNMFATPSDDKVIVSFQPADAGKVLGAEDNDRQILGLRKKNIQRLEDYIVNSIDENFKKLKRLSLTISL